MTSVTIYHNPACSKSRQTLEMIRGYGVEPVIVEYLKKPLSEQQLITLTTDMGVSARGLMRSNETVYKDLNLANTNLSDQQLIAAMAAYPKLMNRPIVVTPQGTRLCRPPELALEILLK